MTNINRLSMQIQAKDSWSAARATTFTTAHTTIETPVFMPVATQAALRGVDLPQAGSLGYKILLANTYHLMLRPGADVFRQFGGIHKFMQWPAAVLTDSGGFQIFSLSRQLKISEEGALFRSYVDGSRIMLTPERSIEVQGAIGSDIMMVLDQCINSTSGEADTRAALELTRRWAARSLAARGDSAQALFGIVQGGSFKELRRESAGHITELPFDGFALGGLAVGESKDIREEIIEYSAALLPEDKPRYLMGVGTPIDLLESVRRGMDMFDCILPTAYAHQGVCYTSSGKVDLRRASYAKVEEPLDAGCGCTTCARYSRAYLCHLVRAGEFVVDQLLSIHNLTFYQSLMQSMRESILLGDFRSFYEAKKPELMKADETNPPRPPARRKDSEMALGDYEVVAQPAGYGSIRHKSSGETMHSVIEPMQEARTLYLDQSGILQKLGETGEPLVVWDAGLGAATNAMTLISAVEALPDVLREIHLISFEQDLDSLRLALRHPKLFKHIRHAAPHAVLREQKWQSGVAALSWSLRQGDMSATLKAAEPPDIIWYDPFSYKVNSSLWSVQTFEMILAACAGKPARLYTYSASTAVRAALLAAGWYVGPGQGSGPKSETTVAYAPAAVEPGLTLLGEAWLSRWERSGAKQPHGSEGSEFLERVRSHRQFSPW